MAAKASLLVAQYSGERAGWKASPGALHHRHSVPSLFGEELGQGLAVAGRPLKDPAVALKKPDELEATYGR